MSFEAVTANTTCSICGNASEGEKMVRIGKPDGPRAFCFCVGCCEAMAEAAKDEPRQVFAPVTNRMTKTPSDDLGAVGALEETPEP